MAEQSDLVTKAMAGLDQAGQIAAGWLLSPAAWSQFGLLAVAYLAARMASKRLSPPITQVLTPPEGKAGLLATARRFALRFLRCNLHELLILLPRLPDLFCRQGLLNLGDERRTWCPCRSR